MKYNFTQTLLTESVGQRHKGVKEKMKTLFLLLKTQIL